ncbi:hypothetical protein I3760_03G015500 [Carya illinoinensis]|nr:hypothetical protein I3760_03G015500 [Carya illinoinensis]
MLSRNEDYRSDLRSAGFPSFLVPFSYCGSRTTSYSGWIYCWNGETQQAKLSCGDPSDPYGRCIGSKPKPPPKCGPIYTRGCKP